MPRIRQFLVNAKTPGVHVFPFSGCDDYECLVFGRRDDSCMSLLSVSEQGRFFDSIWIRFRTSGGLSWDTSRHSPSYSSPFAYVHLPLPKRTSAHQSPSYLSPFAHVSVPLPLRTSAHQSPSYVSPFVRLHVP